MDSTVKLYSLKALEVKTYLFSALFIFGNIAFPQLCHLVPMGGMILLPIYFFTLVAGYKYGFMTGLLTAVASPLVNHLMFGMPESGMLAIILIKSGLLAIAAAYMAQRTKELKMLNLLMVVAFYQVVGMGGEWALTGSLTAALQDVRLGMPGILLQIFGGYYFLKAIARW